MSMAMNLYLGGFAGTDGGWSYARPYQIYMKTTDLSAPGPAKTFVFLDMRPDAVNWGNFMTDMTGFSPPNPSAYKLQDFPGYSHNGGCGFSFGDNHVELKRWSDPRTMATVVSTAQSPNNRDIAWLQAHATALK